MRIDNNLKIRLLKNNKIDYQYLYFWCQQEYIYKYFEQKILTYNEIVNKYHPRTSKNSKVKVYIIEYNNTPIGIIQYQELIQETKELYNLDKDGFDIDIFIGNKEYQNMGIGTNVIKYIKKLLLDDNNILTLVSECRNKNAIACYNKAGFIPFYKFSDYDTLNAKKHEKIVMVCELNNNIKQSIL